MRYDLLILTGISAFIVACIIYLWRTRWPYPGWAIRFSVNGNPPVKIWHAWRDLGFPAGLAWSGPSFSSINYDDVLDYVKRAYAVENDLPPPSALSPEGKPT